MTTPEKIEKIKAKCSEIIALGEKRTQYFKRGLMHTRLRHFMNDEDIAFGLALAGPAEAMARSTLAVIDELLFLMDENRTICDLVLNDILAAWPDELL